MQHPLTESFSESLVSTFPSGSGVDLNALLLQAPVGMALISVPGYRVVFVNDFHLAIIGKRREDVLQKPAFDAVRVSPENEARLLQLLDEAATKGEAVRLTEYETMLERHGRTETIWVNVTFQPLRGNEGAVNSILVMATDVSRQVLDRRQLEAEKAALQRNKSLLDLSMSAGKIGTWHWDAVAGRLTWSPEQLALYGLSPETFGGRLQDFHDRVLPEDLQRMLSAEDLNSNTPGESVYEFRIRRPNGEVRWVQARSHSEFNPDGTLRQITGVNLDVTEEKEAKQKLQQSEEEFRQFSNNITNLAWVTNGEGWIYWYNQRWYEYTGTTLEEMQGWGWEKAHHPSHVDRVLEFVRDAWKKTEPFELIFPLRRYDGEYRWFLTRAVPITENGAIVKWIGTNTDIHEQVLAEEALKKAQAETEAQRRLYEAVAENTPDLVYIFDPKTYHFTYANRSLLRMWGKSWDEAIGKGLRENGYEEWHAAMHEREIDRVVATRQPVRGTVSFPHAELGTRVYDYLFAPVLNQDGEVEAVAGTTRDVSESKAAEEALRQSEERFQNLVATADVGIVLLQGPEMRVEIVNEAYGRLIERKAEELRGKNLFDVIPDAEAAFQPLLHGVLATGEPVYLYDAPYTVRKEGREISGYLNVVYQPYRNAAGSITGVLALVQDVTASVQARKALEESESRFRILADNLPQLIWVSNARGENEYHNKQWQVYSGMNDVEEAWNALIHPEDKNGSAAVYQKAFAAGLPFRYELRLRTRDGGYRWHYSVADPVRDADGKIVRWVGALTDIHIQKTMTERLEAMVRERTRELQRSNEDLLQFAHITSHDLKEPVRKVQVYAGQLATELQQGGSEKAKAHLGKIQKSARRMQDMIEGVLQYSSAGAREVQGEAVDLNALMKTVVSDLELLIRQKEANVSMSDLPTLTTSRVMLRQVLFNLLYNALKFTRPGVPPRIAVTAAESRGAEAGAPQHLAPGRYFLLCIKDNGIGFAPAFAEQIFGTFIRLHSKDQFEGTGLGLALCRKVVERLGGAIWAEGKEGEGAAFFVLLPQQG